MDKFFSFSWGFFGNFGKLKDGTSCRESGTYHWSLFTVINYIFTARKRSCGKVMFLQVSVILFTGGGGSGPGGVPG